jgi:hypothetical protein
MIDRYGSIIFPSFTLEKVKEINKTIKNNIYSKEPADMAAKDKSKIGEFYIVQYLPLMDLIQPWLKIIKQVNRDVFGYDIYWDFEGATFNYNVYNPGGEYGLHIDTMNPDFRAVDTKLTCLLNLSEEPYGGGKFFKINEEKEIQFDSGEGIVFNSLVAHKVTPITKGERITLTYWATGPSWK